MSLAMSALWTIVQCAALTGEVSAFGNPAMVSGRDYSEDFGVWFTPRFFGCRVCGLTLEGDELRLAGFHSSWLHEDYGENREIEFNPDSSDD